MPLVRATSNSNIRKPFRRKRQSKWIAIAGPSNAACPVALAATGTFDISGASYSPLIESVNSLRTFRTDGAGREASLEIFATAMLEVETYPLDSQSAFTMIKRVSLIMPNPLPLDSKGRPT